MGNSHLSKCDEAKLLQLVADTVSATDARVSQVEIKGKVYWAKQVEKVKGRSRVFKISPQKLFDKELVAFENLRQRGAPVPKVVARGERFFVLEDAGQTLHSLWRHHGYDAGNRAQATIQAAIALSAMHQSGVAHGRPVARDVCWDGADIRFVDLENYLPSRNHRKGFSRDLLLFIHSVCSQPVKDQAAIKAAIDAYRERDIIGVWKYACKLVHRYGWLEVFTRPLQMRKDPHALEFKSLPKVRALFF